MRSAIVLVQVEHLVTSFQHPWFVICQIKLGPPLSSTSFSIS
jgi:hypothetical protein